jgi:hypothetical protein
MNFSSAFEASRRDRSAPVGFLVHRSTRGFERRVHRGLKQHENLLPALFPNEVFCVRLHKSFLAAGRDRSFASVSHCSARVSQTARHGQDPHRVLLRRPPRGQQERLPQLRGRTFPTDPSLAFRLSPRARRSRRVPNEPSTEKKNPSAPASNRAPLNALTLPDVDA